MISPIDFLVNDAKVRQPTTVSSTDTPPESVNTGLQVDDAGFTEIRDSLNIGPG